MSIKNEEILDRLYRLVQERKNTPSQSSYISFLLESAAETLTGKLVEEAMETAQAAHQADRDALIRETADLWFHSLVLLGKWQIPPDDIYSELCRRWGTSGFKEKKMRNNQ